MEAAAGGGGAAAAAGGGGGGGIALHDFIGRLGEQRVHFHAMRLRDSLFLWVGAAPALASLAVAMCTPRDSIPVSASLLGDPSDTASACLAQRLAPKFWPGKSWIISQTAAFSPQILKRPGSSHRPSLQHVTGTSWDVSIISRCKGVLLYLVRC
ncbi:proteasome assembly chaperone 4 isoform 1-T1 [Alca torda]